MAGFDLARAVLDEASEGCETSSSADHDQRCGDGDRGVERGVRFLDSDLGARAWLQMREVIACYA